MKAPRAPGRPRTSPLSRAEQLRAAKRAQRERDRRRGLVACSLRLQREDAERLRAGMARPEFQRRLRAFLDEQLVPVDQFDNLAELMWNRTERYLTEEEAFRIYERNWRYVDKRRMKPAERALIDRLVREYGNGVLHA